MKKIIICVGLLLFPAGYLWAQQSVGFSHPHDIQQLLNYRLPSWGYSNFYLDFKSDGNIQSHEEIGTQGEAKSRRFIFLATPSYDLYHESEKRIYSLNSSADLIYNYENHNANNRDNTFRSIINLDGNGREYLHSKLFLLLSEQANFDYRYITSEEQNTIGKKYNFNRHFESHSKLGFGFGRVRNVTPVIRAIRLNERYQTIKDAGSFNPKEIRSVADQFTRYQGYQHRYDRPEKYFWQDMDKAVGDKISALNSFDLFYLTDVLDENIGARFEGWDIAAGGVFDYTNVMSRTEYSVSSQVDRNSSISKHPGFFVKSRWFKNISLRHQLSFSAEGQRMYPISSDQVKWQNSITGQIQWLWNVADRYILKTQLTDNYNGYKSDDLYYQHRVLWRNHSSIGTNLIYFIENRMAISGGILYSLNYRGDSSNNNSFDARDTALSYTVGLRYYFNRKLY